MEDKDDTKLIIEALEGCLSMLEADREVISLVREDRGKLDMYISSKVKDLANMCSASASVHSQNFRMLLEQIAKEHDADTEMKHG